jgi:hypothetical protein
VTSLDGVFDASLALETCLELLVFAILIPDSVGQAEAENLTGASDSDARVAGHGNYTLVPAPQASLRCQIKNVQINLTKA